MTRVPTAADKAKRVVFILVTVSIIITSAFALLTNPGLLGIILLWFAVCAAAVYLLVFEISTLEGFLSAHVLPSCKFLTCPHCGKRNWTTALVRTDL